MLEVMTLHSRLGQQQSAKHVMPEQLIETNKTIILENKAQLQQQNA